MQTSEAHPLDATVEPEEVTEAESEGNRFYYSGGSWS